MQLRTFVTCFSLALGLTAACGGNDDSTSGTTSAKAEFNAANTKIVNPSDKKGGHFARRDGMHFEFHGDGPPQTDEPF